MGRGLKNFRKVIEGAGMRYSIRELGHQIRYAWQRAWRGYDDTQWWGMDYSFISLYESLLTELKTNLHGHPVNLTPEEWEDILNTMVELLKEMKDEDSLIDNYEHEEEIKDEFFRLFSLHFYDLWD